MPLPPGYVEEDVGSGAGPPAGYVLESPIRANQPPAVQPTTGGPVGRFVSNVASALNPFPAIKRAAMGPQNTAEEVATGVAGPLGPMVMDAAKAQGQQFGQAADEWKKGNYLGAVGHGLAGALPVLGPMAARAGEQIGGTEPQYDKYGNVVQSGQAPDVAGGLGTAAATLAPFAAKPLTEAAQATGIPAKVGDVLSESAKRQYNRVLGPTTRPNKVRAGQVVSGYDAQAPELGQGATAPVPGLIDRGMTAWTRRGLQAKIGDTVSDLGQQLEAEYGNLPSNSGIPVAQLQSRLNQAATDTFLTRNPANGQMTATGPESQAGADFIMGRSVKMPDGSTTLRGGLADYITSHAVSGPQGQLVVPFETIRRFRQDWDNIVAAANGYAGGDLTTNMKAAAYKASANGLRELLNGANPDISALNREISFWQKAKDVIDATVMRTQSQSKPLGRKMARVGGQMLGFSHGGVGGAVVGGEVMDALEGAMHSTKWSTVSAITKDRIAQALATGDGTAVKALATGVLVGNEPPDLGVPGMAHGGIIHSGPPELGKPGAKPANMARSGEDIIRGSSNIPLSAEGLKEADHLGSQFARKGGVDRIMTSDLLRARQTAAAIHKHTRAPIVYSGNGLHPWHMGGQEGTPTKQALATLNRYIAKRPNAKIPGRGPDSSQPGESFNHFKRRGIGFAQKLIAEHDKRPREVTQADTHYRFIRLMQSWAKKGFPPSMEIDSKDMVGKGDKPASVHRLYRDPTTKQVRLDSVDMNSHQPLRHNGVGGIYLTRHGMTAYNGGSDGGTV